MTSGWHLGITVGLASGAALGAAGVGCTVTASDAAAEDAGVFEGAEASAPTCDACLASRCTAVMALCETDEGFLAVRACTESAGCDATCKTACACSASSTDGGLPAEILYRAYAACIDERTCGACGADCASTCTSGPPETSPGPCGPPVEAGEGEEDGGLDASAGEAADAGTAPVSPVEACAQCADQKCSEAMRACGVGSECATFLACVHACTRAACVEDCRALYTTGMVAAGELAACVRAGCMDWCDTSNR